MFKEQARRIMKDSYEDSIEKARLGQQIGKYATSNERNAFDTIVQAQKDADHKRIMSSINTQTNYDLGHKSSKGTETGSSGTTRGKNSDFLFIALICAGLFAFQINRNNTAPQDIPVTPVSTKIAGPFHCAAQGSDITLKHHAFRGYFPDGSIHHEASNIFRDSKSSAVINLEKIAARSDSCEQAFGELKKQYPALKP